MCSSLPKIALVDLGSHVSSYPEALPHSHIKLTRSRSVQKRVFYSLKLVGQKEIIVLDVLLLDSLSKVSQSVWSPFLVLYTSIDSIATHAVSFLQRRSILAALQEFSC